MSALAQMLFNEGYYVQGSDLCCNDFCKHLLKQGINIFIGHKRTNINNCDVVVYNSAIKDNVELNEAKKQHKIIMSRSDLLFFVSQKFEKVISISGAHGKTTTSALLYHCLNSAGLNPTLHFGGVLKGCNLGYVKGDNKILITEACEYQDNFLKLKSHIGVVLNIEQEHMDYFKTYYHLKKSFKTFAKNSNIVVINNKNKQNLQNEITFGLNNGDYTAKNISCNEQQRYSFDCMYNGYFLHRFKLNCTGKHNVCNALAVISVCKKLGIKNSDIQKGFDLYNGVKRRFEIIKNTNNNLIVHDYAHHPTEIKKTIDSFKKFAKNKKIAVFFQPHTYSRTKKFLNLFYNSFCDADYVGVLKTYPAREKFDYYGSAKHLTTVIKQNNKAVYIHNFSKLRQLINKKLDENYAILILGAGDINDVCKYFEMQWKFFKAREKMCWHIAFNMVI